MAIVELMVEFADVVTVAILNLHFIIIIILWRTRYNVPREGWQSSMFMLESMKFMYVIGYGLGRVEEIGL